MSQRIQGILIGVGTAFVLFVCIPLVYKMYNEILPMWVEMLGL